MRMGQVSSGILLLCVAAFVLPSIGCGKKDTKETEPQAKAKVTNTEKKDPGEVKGKKDLDPAAKHEGWWCQEHGVPEGMCSLCSNEVAGKLKKEGDWCKMHDRAKSQCFKCDPTAYKKYEAMYVAKYNKKPEPPPKAEFEK